MQDMLAQKRGISQVPPPQDVRATGREVVGAVCTREALVCECIAAQALRCSVGMLRLALERVQRCRDQAEYEMLRQNWGHMHRAQNMDLRWSEDQLRVLEDVKAALAVVDVEERARMM